MTTITTIDCVITTPPPLSATFDGGPATNGSCAAVAAGWPGDTVTPTPITSTTGAPSNPLLPGLPVTTTTVPAPTTTSVTNSPSGYAGISGGGENCGAGPTGMCPTPPITGVPTTTIPAQAIPLAFTGADLGLMGAVGLGAVLVGAVALRAVRRAA